MAEEMVNEVVPGFEDRGHEKVITTDKDAPAEKKMPNKKRIGRPKGSKDRPKTVGEIAVARGMANPAALEKRQKTLGLVPEEANPLITTQLMLYNLPTIDTDDPQQVSDRLAEYMNICLENGIRPTTAGMALSLGINRQSLWEWKTGGVKKPVPIREIVNKAYALMETLLEDWMSTGKINPVSGIFLMKQIGYSDKQEVVVKAESVESGLSERELEARYLASVVDE